MNIFVLNNYIILQMDNSNLNPNDLDPNDWFLKLSRGNRYVWNTETTLKLRENEAKRLFLKGVREFMNGNYENAKVIFTNASKLWISSMSSLGFKFVGQQIEEVYVKRSDLDFEKICQSTTQNFHFSQANGSQLRLHCWAAHRRKRHPC